MHNFVNQKQLPNIQAELSMEVEASTIMKKLLLVLSCMILAIGCCGGPLIMRLYFIHGGQRIWFSSWLETGGWPIILIPLISTYIHRRKTQGSDTRLVVMKPFVFLASLILGCVVGLDNYLYAYGNAKLPVSTSSLIVASQLAFTAGFAFLIVKQKLTAYSINAVVLLTIGAAVLGVDSSGDRPEGESNKEYVVGFVMTVAAAGLYGLFLPLVELTFVKAKQDITFTLVMEMQLLMSFVSTVFATVGMLVNNDFKAIPREAREYELGEAKYYVVVVCTAIIWQCFFFGALGIILCASSLLSGIVVSALLPATEILAVLFYHESFEALKIVAFILSLWGFVSYFYGEIKHGKKKNQTPIVGSPQQFPQTEITQMVSRDT